MLARRAGLRVGILSGRSSEPVDAPRRRARHRHRAPGRRGQGARRCAEILAAEGLAPSQVAYIGDDVNDLAVMAEVGLSAAPADAPFEVRAQAFMVTDARGGHGCLREFLEAILRARGEWDGLVAGITAPRA